MVSGGRSICASIGVVVLLGCPGETDLSVCEAMYGRPNETTGLSEAECGPACRCECGEWIPEPLPADAAAQLLAFELVDPPPRLLEDPYTSTSTPGPSAGVCGVRIEAGGVEYALQTYASRSAAEDDGASVTHEGECGLCSSLEDLAAYVKNEDLTTPVRACGFTGISEGKEANLACLAELGFTAACADIWYFNTRSTRTKCLGPCLEAVGLPYHLEDGSLNSCLQCDEDRSGPWFKKFAGRTRRNSGLPAAICRPCASVGQVDHDYLSR